MKTIVGKLLPLLCLSFSVYSELVLEITTSDDLILKQAGVGQPFVIRVTDTNASGSIRQPEIQGIDEFLLQGNTFSMYTVNATSKIVYKYTVRIDKQGTYRVGPAKIKESNLLQESNCLDILVGTEPIVDKKHQQRIPPELMRLEINKNDLVVGEKITCSLTFYSPDSIQATIQGIYPPDDLEDDFTVVEQGLVEQGDININGNHYLYGRWTWYLYPKRVGLLVIPAWRIDYSKLNQRSTFFSFMGLCDNKRMYSNAVDIHVDPLPPHDSPIKAIGSFDTYSATIDATNTTQRSGVILQLKLTGNGNWHMLTHPILEGMPKTLRSYESKSLLEGAFPNESKFFEYVIQGMKAGNWEIPAQHFTYFDTEEKAYKTLSTLPLYLDIAPTNVPVVLPNTSENVMQLNAPDLFLQLRENDVPIQIDWAFSLVVFIALCMVPLAGAAGWAMRIFFTWYCQKNRALINKRFAFKIAKQQLKEAWACSDHYALFPLFIHLFAARLQLPASQISKEIIDRVLRTYCNSQMLRSWHLFINSIEHARFVQKSSEGSMFFEAAYKWIELFEKKGIDYEMLLGRDLSVDPPMSTIR